MEYLPNITVIDMAQIVANHDFVSRKEDVIKYVFDENGILLKHYKTVELQIQKTQQLQIVYKCQSDGSARIIRAKYLEMMQDKNAIKFTW